MTARDAWPSQEEKPAQAGLRVRVQGEAAARALASLQDAVSTSSKLEVRVREGFQDGSGRAILELFSGGVKLPALVRLSPSGLWDLVADIAA